MGLVNLISEIEQRLSGTNLHGGIADAALPVDDESTHLLVVFDGLGSGQLDHPSAGALKASTIADLTAPFPTTTTVSLATLATGLAPPEHGLIAYLLWDPSVRTILNTIHMTSAWGDEVNLDLTSFLPAPNVFERMSGTGIESVVIQPANFAGSALTRVLYRGARFEGYRHLDEAVDITVDVASHSRRFVILYVPHVDVAAHVSGQDSAAYAEAVAQADTVWSRLMHRTGDEVVLVGTADHGHVDISDGAKIMLSDDARRGIRVFGDPRALFVTGDPSGILAETGGTWCTEDDLDELMGQGARSPSTLSRLPDGVILLPDGAAAFTPYMNDRLVGHHGGITDAERLVPLLARR